MCGAYNIEDSPYIDVLIDHFSVDMPDFHRNIRPGSRAAFIYRNDQGNQLQDGLWSLLIEPRPDGSGYRPSPKYSTFNARAGSLGSSPLWKKRFSSQRAIIPATGFHEWTGPKGHKQCYNITAVDAAIAFAGLYEFWDFGGDIVPSYTLITLPPHPRFSHIHDKSIPLMLRPEDYDLWLDPHLHNTDPFQDLLKSQIRVPLRVVPVRSPERLESVGAEEMIAAD